MDCSSSDFFGAGFMGVLNSPMLSNCSSSIVALLLLPSREPFLLSRIGSQNPSVSRQQVWVQRSSEDSREGLQLAHHSNRESKSTGEFT